MVFGAILLVWQPLHPQKRLSLRQIRTAFVSHGLQLNVKKLEVDIENPDRGGMFGRFLMR